MIDYTQFGAQTIDDPQDDEAKRRLAVQQNPAGPAVAQPQQGVAGSSQQPASTPGGNLANQAAGQQPTTSTAGSPTFRDLQVAGIPRPAPPQLPTNPLAQGFPQSATPQGAPQGGQLQGSIVDILRQLLANPTAYNQEAMQREYDTGARKIDDDYALRQKGVNEEMARRGLYDSSVAAGNLSDLNVGRRSAQEDLMNNLLMKRADSQDSGIRSALSQAMGFNQYEADEQARQNALLAAWYQMFGL